jgi:hypothetical protein
LVFLVPRGLRSDPAMVFVDHSILNSGCSKCPFWLVRLYVQFFGYSSQTWKGKPFETMVHYVFIALWSYLSMVFGLIYFG